VFLPLGEAARVLPRRDESVRHSSADPGKAVMWERAGKVRKKENASKSTCLI